MKAFFKIIADNLTKRVLTHIFFCCAILVFFIYLSSLGLSVENAVYGFLIVIIDVYTGRWIWKQRASGGTWVDLFRMYFLSFFFLSAVGLAGFARFVEPGLSYAHYLESLINIGVLTFLSLSAGFFVSKIRKNHPAKQHRAS